MGSRRVIHRKLLVAMMMLATCTGCSTWKSVERQTTPRLPHSRMSPDSVGVEVATVTLGTHERETLEGIVAKLDEQVLDSQLRRHLANNGFVGGLLGTQLPAEIQLLLLEAADRREYPTAINQRDPADQQRFVQVRAGARKGIGGIWPPFEKLETQHHDGELLIPETFEHAAPEFAMRCQQLDRNVVSVKITPEIEHGPLRRKYVSDRGSFHPEAQQDRVSYEDLAMEFKLRPGETCLVTCNSVDGSLGRRVFQNAEGTKQRLLLIRLAQSQVAVAFHDE